MVGYSDSGKEVGLLAASAARSAGRRRAARASRARPASRSASSTAAASPSRAAAGPRSRPSSRCRRAASRAATRRPSRARRSITSTRRPELAMRTLELVVGGALLAHPRRRGARRRTRTRRVTSRPSSELAEDGPARLPRARLGGPALRRVLRDGDAARRDRAPAHRLAAEQAARGRARGAARHPVGLRLDADPRDPARLVRRRQRARGIRRSATGGAALLAEMAARWPFFRTVLDNVRDGPREDRPRRSPAATPSSPSPTRGARSGRGSAPSTRGPRPGSRSSSASSGCSTRTRRLQRSIELRNPYVDPMSFLQVSLLRRKRAGDTHCDRAILLSINGIAAGMRNTG